MTRDAFAFHIKGGGHSHMTAQPLRSGLQLSNLRASHWTHTKSLVASEC